MVNSLLKKMIAVLLVSILLTAVTAWSMVRLYLLQQSHAQSHAAIIRVQLDVDELRAHLIQYLQYQDDMSFLKLSEFQHELSETWSRDEVIGDRSTGKLKQINTQLAGLIDGDRIFREAKEKRAIQSTYVIQRQNIMRMRYNMLIQEMNTHLAHAHRRLLSIEQNAIDRTYSHLTLILIGCYVVFFAAVIGLIRRFRQGAQTVSRGIFAIRDGVFSHKIQAKALDKEFQYVAGAFNEMSEQLQHNTFTRAELETEIERQTKELSEQKETLKYLSDHDALTRLLNRRALDRELTIAMDKAERTGVIIAVLFMDINKFKPVNDHYGHAFGDKVLVELANRLTRHTRKTDMIARFGGDEFVVCLDLLRSKAGVTEKARCLIQAVEKPITVQNHTVQVGVSIGIAYFSPEENFARDVLERADTAMYVAKESKDSRYVEHNPLSVVS
ncbi:diguanylate cyclase (plasmid) [Vibrio nigripulchritudo]|uniref:diguanylate cyclase domain-containing protein n=1 Tax=Vibrio nigripulchritudo TaxID=28173 RepID=UPI00190CAB09|nr:diguanylate cyclase [Vibrio nigripulchritudo]BCL73664.1 diguanylate cyclase [Vibrio nigripulchritudo]BDU35033.1 diguanylate cyclase [Vibrio nigripulchritudo]